MTLWNFPLREGSGVRTFRGPLFFLAAIGMLAVLLSTETAYAAIGFAQGAYATPQAPQSSASVTFPKAQAAGNLNVVVVGWNDTTAAVNSVTDSVGNVYTLAVGPTQNSDHHLSQSIYYARGILVAGPSTNSVTVRFTVPAHSADIRILEYSGLDQLNPVDVTAAAIGTDAASNSGAATTTYANDLIFGANIVSTSTSGPGTGFTNRMITSPDGDLAEDRVVPTAGSYSATAPLSRSGPWIMQMVAFKAASGGTTDSSPPTAPSTLLATSAGSGGINLAWTASSDNVGVTNYLLERCQGIGCTAFTQIATSTATTYTNAGLLPGTNYTYRTRATDAAGNLSGYSNMSAATTNPSTASPISFIQLAYATPQSSQLTVPVTFASAQTAGNLNVVVVGWNDTTAAVNTVTDSVGNVYTLAVGPTKNPGSAGTFSLTQSIYYAKNIVGAAANVNTVTVGFTVAAQSADIRILEYTGIDQVNPVDVIAAAIGTDATTNSGAATTTTANDLIFGANTVYTGNVGAGAGFTNRVITSPDHDIAEDRVVSAVGSYSASAPLTSPGPWIMQMVAFRGSLTGASPGPAYPVKVGPTGRYLVDQQGVPFLMLGESPQAMIGNLSLADAELFLANRHSHGFNTVWINLLCTTYTGCNANGTTFDGLAPFTVAGDVSTPNAAYFARADSMLQLASQYGFLVLLDPAETGGWLSVLQSNGLAKARAYGQWLGTRYKSFPNLVWVSGNDFQSWSTPSDDALVQAVALGIKDTDSTHPHTVELNYPVSTSLDDSSWAPIISLNAAYTQSPTYAEVLHGYNQSASLPVFMVEANYEFENNTGMDPSTPAILRRQEYWSALSGSTGQLFGNHYTSFFLSGWKAQLDTPGAVQMGYVKALFAPRAWYELVPDQAHTVVTAGYGTFASTGSIGANDYVTAARTPSGKLVMAYVPSARTVTVVMSQLSGPATARWYDPVVGSFTSIAGSPFANTGSHNFTTPGANAGGDQDWVLILEVP